MQKLTAKQELFCEHYINNGFNGYKAALSAGYKKNSAAVIASENLRKPYIKSHIQKRLKSILSDTEQLTLEWLQNVMKIAKADIRKVAEWKDGETVHFKPSDDIDDDAAYCISEISDKVSKDGINRSLKFESKTQALNLLGKYLNILNDAPPMQEDKKAKMSKEEREKRIAYLLNKGGKDVKEED